MSIHTIALASTTTTHDRNYCSSFLPSLTIPHFISLPPVLPTALSSSCTVLSLSFLPRSPFLMPFLHYFTSVPPSRAFLPYFISLPSFLLRFSFLLPFLHYFTSILHQGNAVERGGGRENEIERMGVRKIVQKKKRKEQRRA